MKIHWKKLLLLWAVLGMTVCTVPAADAAPGAAGGYSAIKTTLPMIVPEEEEDLIAESETANEDGSLVEDDDSWSTRLRERCREIWEDAKDSCYTNFVKDGRWRYLAEGFLITMEISLAAVLLGVIIGFIVAVIRSVADQTGKYKILNGLCKVYLTVVRGTPMVVQLLIIYFVIFGSCDVSKVVVAIIAFGVNSGAYVTEIIRSGINAIDPGQLEAGRSLGLSYLQTMRLVVLPQAFKNVLPALGNEFIALLKETSISGYIALQDLTKGGDIIRSQTYDAFLPLTAVALIYLAVVMLFTKLLSILERKLKKNER